jgi:hypothetical protein
MEINIFLSCGLHLKKKCIKTIHRTKLPERRLAELGGVLVSKHIKIIKIKEVFIVAVA